MTKSVNILVVDDETGILELFARIFKSNGYQIDTAKNGSEAISKARKNSYRLAFIDIVMPGINGLESYKALKKINPEMQGIMVTGFAVPDLIEEALASGAYACIKKPFQIKKILNLTRKILKKIHEKKTPTKNISN